MPVAPRPDGEDEDAAAAAPPAQNADNEFAEWQNEHRADEGEDEVDEVSLSLYIAQTPVRMKKISLVARLCFASRPAAVPVNGFSALRAEPSPSEGHR